MDGGETGGGLSFLEPEREETANQVATLTFIIDCVLHIETAFLAGDAVCLSGPNVADGVALWKRVGWVDNHLYTIMQSIRRPRVHR